MVRHDSRQNYLLLAINPMLTMPKISLFNNKKAPVAPSSSTKRKTLRLKAAERLANPLAPRKVHRPDSAVTDTFLDTKKDKRLIKHASFVSKVVAQHTISKAARKNAKRHARAKLQTNLASLADALPQLTRGELEAGAAEKDGRVRHRSLNSKPGALKKKERVVRGEMERFGASLAQLSTVREAEPANQTTPTTAAETTTAPSGQTETTTTMDGIEGAAPQRPSAAANRFAALRGFIAATMEQNPAFANQTALGGKGS